MLCFPTEAGEQDLRRPAERRAHALLGAPVHFERPFLPSPAVREDQPQDQPAVAADDQAAFRGAPGARGVPGTGRGDLCCGVAPGKALQGEMRTMSISFAPTKNLRVLKYRVSPLSRAILIL